MTDGNKLIEVDASGAHVTFDGEALVIDRGRMSSIGIGARHPPDSGRRDRRHRYHRPHLPVQGFGPAQRQHRERSDTVPVRAGCPQ